MKLFKKTFEENKFRIYLACLKKKDFILEYQIALIDERKLFFSEEFQLINIAGITALENHHLQPLIESLFRQPSIVGKTIR